MISPFKPSGAPHLPEQAPETAQDAMATLPSAKLEAGTQPNPWRRSGLKIRSGVKIPSGVKIRSGLKTGEYPWGLIRRIAVSVAAAAAATALFLVSSEGMFAGGSVPEILSPGGSLLAPASVAWWLWLPVVAGWFCYALYQWLPRQQINSRQERFGWLILISQGLAFAWLLAVSSGSAGGLLFIGAAQTFLGLASIHSLNLHPPSFRFEGLMADIPLGIFLASGVFSLVTALAFILARAEVDLAGWGGTVWTLTALITMTVGITVICMTDRGHLSVALCAVWVLSCVAFERLTGTPHAIDIGVAAATGAFLILVSAGSRRHQVDHERRRNERQSQAGSGRLSSV